MMQQYKSNTATFTVFTHPNAISCLNNINVIDVPWVTLGHESDTREQHQRVTLETSLKIQCLCTQQSWNKRPQSIFVLLRFEQKLRFVGVCSEHNQ